MKPTLNLLVFLLVTSVLVGCGNKNKRPDSELVTDKDPVRSMLSLIPADTPYAFVALEPMPVAPMLEWTKNYTGAISDILPNYSDMLQDEYLDPSVKLFYAVLSEFDGRFDAEGLQELGFSLSPRFAIYGVGALPAMRLDLGDAEKFAQFVARVETKAGLERVDEKLGDTDFWSYTTNSNVTVMAIQDKQLVVGWAPPDAAPVTTPYLL